MSVYAVGADEQALLERWGAPIYPRRPSLAGGAGAEPLLVKGA